MTFRGRQQADTQGRAFSKPVTAQNSEAAIPNITTKNHPQTSNFRRRWKGRGMESQTIAAEVSSTTSQSEDFQRSPQDLDGGGCIFASQKRYRRSEIQIPRVLLSSFRIPKEDGWNQTCIRLEEIERKLRGRQLQDGVAIIHLKAKTQEGLHDITGFGRCIHSHPNSQVLQEVLALLLERFSIPVQGTSARSNHQYSHVLQSAPPDIFIGQSAQLTNIRLPGRYSNHRRIEGNLQTEYRSSFCQTNGKRVQDQDGEFDKNASQSITHLGMIIDSRNISLKVPSSMMPEELHRESSGYFSSSNTWEINSETDIRPKERRPVCIENMDVDSEIDRACHKESQILKWKNSYCFLPVEPDFAGNKEYQKRAIGSETSHTTLEVRELVSRTAETLHLPTIITTSS
ncbi:hypothetical protein AYI68_g5984 [Smittium mucronatum]|uniref:Uncharacterized protein n=1 Tax=Smittium mucronatum TaxID=133383 RepID=A0A1R0GSP7_9FUNG|nr:hypothetical protein AYI68_g5984 [Smittium mucronatum]